MVYGATGRVGRLVSEELAGSSGVLLAARDPSVERTGAALELPVAVTDIAGLAGVLQPGDVLVNLAGPFDLSGDTVVSTAITSQVTYLDAAVEPAFLDRLHRDQGPAAVRARVTLLPSIGVAALVGHLVAHEAVVAAAGDARSVAVAYLSVAGLDVDEEAGRRALVRALTRDTVAYRGGRRVHEPVARRRRTVQAGGHRHDVVSLGGAEVWSLPGLHPELEEVEVLTGALGILGPGLAVLTTPIAPHLTWPLRLGAVEGLVDRAAALAPGVGLGGRERAVTRVVAQVAGADGQPLSRREAVGGDPVLVTARLAAASAIRVAERDLRDLPVGVTDPMAVLGVDGVADMCSWAGVVVM